MDLEDLQRQLDEFATERDWNQFHTPKNLAMALAGEAGELLEIFQWLTGDQSAKGNLSDDQLVRSKEEIADIVIYVLRLCDKLEIDLEHAIIDKMEKNAQKYPVSLSKGNATKYSDRDD